MHTQLEYTRIAGVGGSKCGTRRLVVRHKPCPGCGTDQSQDGRLQNGIGARLLGTGDALSRATGTDLP